jgi:hypothetical protein
VTTFWKVMAGLLLSLPPAAYVGGTLVSSQADMPTERAPVVLSPTPTLDEPTSPSARPDPDGRPNNGRAEDDRGDDRRGEDGRSGGDQDADDEGDENGFEIVRPEPEDFDDDRGEGDDGAGGSDDDGADDD